jgi:hypothetical protein
LVGAAMPIVWPALAIARCDGHLRGLGPPIADRHVKADFKFHARSLHADDPPMTP